MSLTFHSSLINNFNDVVGNVDGIPTNITWKSTLRGLKPELNGADAKITYGDIGTIKSIAIWGHLRSTTESILDLNGTQTIDIASGTVRGNSWTAPTIYVDGAATASLSDLTGYHQIIITTGTGIAASAVVAGLISAAYGKLIVDDIRGYDNELSSAEALALYNATSGEYGVRIAEFSHQHDPAAVIPITDDTVLQIGGKLAGDAVDTISDRALSNDATIHGAMKTDGFLAGGRRFVAANGNYLHLDSHQSLRNPENHTYIIIFSPNVAINADSGDATLLNNGSRSDIIFGTEDSIGANGDITYHYYDGSFNGVSVGKTTWEKDMVYVVAATKNTSSGHEIYLDGVLRDSDNRIDDEVFSVGRHSSLCARGWLATPDNYANIRLYAAIMVDDAQQNMREVFNALAVLPFWSINYRDYPDNVTTYTDRFPHSSSIIASGAFKVDDDKIQCTSAGTLTYSASNEFDGAEYVKVKIDGVWYAGTGTITQGNTTVSIAQGSNKITVAMGAGDTIDDILITFRKPVST